ncbi:Volume-regulated anion channel subunit LRRC8A [Acropora cervicornis]|uniref:Volume-regulated anion channel subunit LRRC8A n=1 Tax=Acropora cervicornis TaxID=6130 RepID=A0AAD9UR74_ACRCE|nr:Volume-regulated anion channel subunit LRRC8A [Acropora cervicornis]
MDSEKPNFHTTKLLTTWWDLVDHYVLVVMFAVSVASVGFQTTQDRLICIPAVNCSNFARNDSVVRRWSDFSDVLESCNQSASSIVLTKMSDRRQYDYIDKECYKKMHWFSAYYSLIFLAKAVILLAISNFWQKHPNSASALAHCEHLLLEFTKGDILVTKDKETQKHAEQKLLKRLKVFKQCYSQKITKFNRSSVTGHYRLRGVVDFMGAFRDMRVSRGLQGLDKDLIDYMGSDKHVAKPRGKWSEESICSLYHHSPVALEVTVNACAGG